MIMIFEVIIVIDNCQQIYLIDPLLDIFVIFGIILMIFGYLVIVSVYNKVKLSILIEYDL